MAQLKYSDFKKKLHTNKMPIEEMFEFEVIIKLNKWVDDIAKSNLFGTDDPNKIRELLKSYLIILDNLWTTSGEWSELETTIKILWTDSKEVFKVLPLLLGKSKEELYYKNKPVNLKVTLSTVEEVVKFFKVSGLDLLFLNKENGTRDLYSYVLGLTLGKSTHLMKQNSNNIFLNEIKDMVPEFESWIFPSQTYKAIMEKELNSKIIFNLFNTVVSSKNGIYYFILINHQYVSGGVEQKYRKSVIEKLRSKLESIPTYSKDKFQIVWILDGPGFSNFDTNKTGDAKGTLEYFNAVDFAFCLETLHEFKVLLDK